MVMATLGMYAGLYVTYKFFSFLKPSKPAAAPAITSSAETGKQTIPSMADDSFDAFSAVPGNMEKWEKSLDAWANQS